MNNKTRFIPLAIIGAILLSLLAIVPAFGEGTVSFIDPADIEDKNTGALSDSTPDEQEWARQGGSAGLMVEDSDLDVPIQRVLLPSDLTSIGTGSVAAHSTTLTLGAGATAPKKDDYLLIGDGTVRQVSSVNNDDSTYTLSAPYAKEQDGAVYKVTIRDDVFDDCVTCARAEDVTGSLTEFGSLGELTTQNEIIASGVGDRTRVDMAPANRLAGVNLGGSTDRGDILIVHVALDGTETMRAVRRVSGKTVSMADSQSNVLPAATDETLYAVYWSEEQNETGTNIKIRSQAHQDRVTVVLTETTPTSGEFVLEIGLSVPPTGQDAEPTFDSSPTIPTLPVNPRDVITLSHPDDSATVIVETTGPVFSGFGPADGDQSRDNRPEITAQVIDGDSGLDEKNIEVIFDVGGTIVNYKPEDDGDANSISGGFEITQRLTGNDAPDDDAIIYWWVKATDEAGNVGYSDAKLTVNDDANPCKPQDVDDENMAGLVAGGCQGFKIVFDESKPTLLRAETGRHWDPSLDTGDDDDKTEYRVTKASDTTILVAFSEHLDDTTVTANDFEVNGSTPLDADVQNVEVRAVEGVDGQGDDRGYVFLTVSEINPNARPKVELVGEVSDVAGNRQNAGQVDDATDRIAPSLTVTLADGDRPVTKDKVKLTITTNEDVGTPSATFYLVNSKQGDNPDTDATIEDDFTIQTVSTDERTAASVVFKSAREYEATLDAPGDGLYTVYVTASDASGGNMGTAGDKSAPIDVDSDTSAILFERDTGLGEIDVDPGTPGAQDEFSIDDPNAFITIDFSAEGDEYDAQTNGNDLDTHASVTIVSAMLDGVDIIDDLQANESSNVFLFRAAGLDLGKHEIEVTAMDEAGNKHATADEATIIITERKPYTLKLNPGWNLVSVPGEPMDSDINSVISADHPAQTVLTYDPSVPGGWLTALRGSDGSFSGTLTDISAGRAYWINTPSFQGLKVDIPKQAAGVAQPLPLITLAEGWNLIPILDVDGDFELSDAEGYNYFNGLSEGTITGIYTFNTITNSWLGVAQADVEIGKGYWVYATDAGVIVP